MKDMKKNDVFLVFHTIIYKIKMYQIKTFSKLIIFA